MLNVLPKSVCSKWNRTHRNKGDRVDKFDALIGARSGFKGQELVDFNKGAKEAAAKGALSGSVTASYLAPLPLNVAYKATRVAFLGLKNWKVARGAKVIGDAAAAQSRLSNPKMHKVISVAGKSLARFGKFMERMTKAGRNANGLPRGSGPPRDLRHRVTQMVSETATRLLTAPKPFAIFRPGTTGGRTLQSATQFHNKARWGQKMPTVRVIPQGTDQVGMLVASIMGKSDNHFKRTRAGLGVLDKLYYGAARKVGTSAPVLFGRVQLMREHVSNNTAIGEMNNRSPRPVSRAYSTQPPWYDKHIPNPGWGWREKNVTK